MEDQLLDGDIDGTDAVPDIIISLLSFTSKNNVVKEVSFDDDSWGNR